jgi:hypothetical protein
VSRSPKVVRSALAIVEGRIENAQSPRMRTANFQSRTLQESVARCLSDLDQVLVEVKQRIEESRRIDELLKIIGVAHGPTREETIKLQSEHVEEREEYKALQETYRRTLGKISAVAAQARQCLVDGFPATEEISDEFETLMIRYGKMEVQSDLFILKVRGLIRKASGIIGEDTFGGAAGSTRAESYRGGRTPDIETSRQRIVLCDRLSRELATLSPEVKKYTTVAKLKMKYPDFKVWEILSATEQQELLNDEFKPRAYANRLALRFYGLTSLSTLKKDRKKLRGAQERELPA